MRISNITIENFRCYYEKNKVSFNNDGKITLIWGDSGYGKSSLLQFFKWMFYDDPDFGLTNDKPLFNMCKYNECSPNDKIRVFGQVDFDHLGEKYSLSREVIFNYSFSPMGCSVCDKSLKLEILENDNWIPFKGDITNKINSILPIGLSKFFLLDGEKSRDIVLNSKELKKAIHSLFGLDAYANAISHIGRTSKKNSVLGYYNSQMSSKMTIKSGTTVSAFQVQERLQEYDEKIEKLSKEIESLDERIGELSSQRDGLLKRIGQVSNKESLERDIKDNKKQIELNEKSIIEKKAEIGDLFRKYYPYIFLSKLTKYSSSVLREKNNELNKNYSAVFENLKKELLKEIEAKGYCVCGRELDDDSKKYIDDIISVMPPDSYDYRYKQFVSKSKKQIALSDEGIMQYDEHILDISKLEENNSSLERANNEKLDEMKRLSDSQKLVDEYQRIDAEITKLRNEKESKQSVKSSLKTKYNDYDRLLKRMKKDDAISKEYSEKIEFFEELLKELETRKERMEHDVKETLNECVRETFAKLTTQRDIDPDKIQFINDDFSLRTTFLAGGQQAVDVYSYVIGIVEALQKFKLESNETPIIVDAPFAFTGDEQSEHIFNTLPTVSKQTILLTLDLNKIRRCLNNTDLYEFFVIDDESNDKAVIRKGDINDFNF